MSEWDCILRLHPARVGGKDFVAAFEIDGAKAFAAAPILKAAIAARSSRASGSSAKLACQPEHVGR